ncbi:MAG: WXG100 family type VII secretion target [Clostridia bacterium]|nr:WXG100 family type VII secretion target [Clostridia bacterium]
MAVKIKVDHSKLESTASQIEQYVQTLKRKMKNADGEINTLSSTWQGKDATQFRSKWNAVTNQDSVYANTVKQLESYAQFLRYAAQKYKEAQTKAINSANSLPR